MHRAHAAARVAIVLLAAAATIPPRPADAQTDGILQVDDEVYRFLFRQQTSGRLGDAFLTAQPIAAHTARALLDSIAAQDSHAGSDGSREGSSRSLNAVDRRILDRLRGVSMSAPTAHVNEKLPFVFTNGVDLYAGSGEGYRFQLNPLLNVRVGRARLSGDGVDETVPVWQSTRGLRASGSFADAIFFEARLEENQRRVVDANYDADRKTAPRLGKANLDAEREVLDYLVATGVVGYRSRFFEVRFGRDRNRWGPAIGAVGLSNYGPVSDQLQIRTTFGPVQYTNLFASLTTGRIAPRDGIIPKKYAAMHRLTIRLPRRVELSFSEFVNFATDSLGARRSFDVAYLNPVIFLRAAEADRGSPDNVLLGASASWVAYPGYRIYGGILLDELRVSQIGDGWWANKWAVQLGAHVVPHPRADVRVEYTRLRPYMYAHVNPLNAHLHYDDVLGHPAGPNAIDWLVVLRARATEDLHATATFYHTVSGVDTTGANFGSNPRLSNNTRVSDTDVRILQGVRMTETYAELLVSYEILPRLFAEASVAMSRTDHALTGVERAVIPMAGFRWGLVATNPRY